MKILLIKPPVRDFYQTSLRTQPTGLAYIASSLISHGHDVDILDCQINKKKTISIPPEFSYLSELYPSDDRSPFKLFTGFYHFGMDWDEIYDRIQLTDADDFGISSLFTPYHNEAVKVAEIIKNCYPKKPVVMGGAHVSCDPEGVLKDNYVDYVIMGEGEVRFPLLLNRIQNKKINKISGIDGIGYKDRGNVYIHPARYFIRELDDLPYPAIDLYDSGIYSGKKKQSAVIITSRGCPHKCSYCSAHLTMGSGFRARSPEAVVDEMKYYSEKFGIREFDIEDDNFTFNRERARCLLELIIKEFGSHNIRLSAMNGVSFASLDRELLLLMKNAGFDTVNLSFVSTDTHTKKRMNRPQPVLEFDDIVEESNMAGLQVIAYGIMGMPGQTVEEMTDTIIYLMSRHVLMGPSIYYPTPGTALFEKCREDDFLPASQLLWRSSAFPVETNQFSRIDLATLLRLSRVVNFIKGKIGEEFNDGITLGEIIRRIDDIADSLDLSDTSTIWMQLLLKLSREKTFHYLKKQKNRNDIFITEKIISSEKVINYFFRKALDTPVKKYKI